MDSPADPVTGNCMGCGTPCDFDTGQCLNAHCFFGPNTTQPLGSVPVAAAGPRFFGDPDYKPDVPTGEEWEGHYWAKNKHGRSYCIECGLECFGPVIQGALKSGGQEVLKFKRRGITHLGKPLPKCDPDAKR